MESERCCSDGMVRGSHWVCWAWRSCTLSPVLHHGWPAWLSQQAPGSAAAGKQHVEHLYTVRTLYTLRVHVSSQAEMQLCKKTILPSDYLLWKPYPNTYACARQLLQHPQAVWGGDPMLTLCSGSMRKKGPQLKSHHGQAYPPSPGAGWAALDRTDTGRTGEGQPRCRIAI